METLLRKNAQTPCLSDDRLYAFLILENQLRALIVSDPRARSAAAAVTVRVGDSSNPSHRPGLAHLLEHVLLRCHKGYPGGKSLQRFLSSHAGQCNAETELEETVYYLQIAAGDTESDPGSVSDGYDATKDGEAKAWTPTESVFPSSPFQEALDRLASIFVAPSFDPWSVNREVEAVDNEHAGNVLHDLWRVNQVKIECCNPRHPIRQFSTGSRQHLEGRSPTTLASDLQDFFERHYSANLMDVCVVAPYPVEVLESWVERSFTKIPNKRLKSADRTYRRIPQISKEQTGRMIRIVPIEDTKLLQIEWCVPRYAAKRMALSWSFIMSSLTSQKDGGLESALYEKSLALGVSANFSPILSTHERGVFQISVSLTEQGLDSERAIVDLVFAYLAFLRKKSIPKSLLREHAEIGMLSMNYAPREDALEYAVQQSQGMIDQRERKGVFRTRGGRKASRREVRRCLSLLSTKGAVVTHIARSNVSVATQREPVYGTMFSIEELPRDVVSSWNRPTSIEDFRFPEKNHWMPKSAAAVVCPRPDPDFVDSIPQILLRRPGAVLFHKKDYSFLRPVSVLRIEVSAPVQANLWHDVNSCLLELVLENALSEIEAEAEDAGLFVRIDVDLGVSITFSGFTETLEPFVEHVLKKIVNCPIRENEFEAAKDELMRSWVLRREAAGSLAYAQHRVGMLSCEPYFDYHELIRQLEREETGPESVNAVRELLVKGTSVRAMIHGHADEDWAARVFTNACRVLESGREPWRKAARRMVQFSTEYDTVSLSRCPSQEDENSAVVVTYQVETKNDVRLQVLVTLLQAALHDGFFEALRTNQGIGYIVECELEHMQGVSHLNFLVQSKKPPPEDICRRVDTFLGAFRFNRLINGSECEWESRKQSLKALQVKPDQNLEERSQRYWRYVAGEYTVADWHQRVVRVLESTTLQDITSFFDTYLYVGGAGRRKLISLVYGNAHAMPDAVQLRSQSHFLGMGMPLRIVKDVRAFRDSSFLYPSEASDAKAAC